MEMKKELCNMAPNCTCWSCITCTALPICLLHFFPTWQCILKRLGNLLRARTFGSLILGLNKLSFKAPTIERLTNLQALSSLSLNCRVVILKLRCQGDRILNKQAFTTSQRMFGTTLGRSPQNESWISQQFWLAQDFDRDLFQNDEELLVIVSHGIHQATWFKLHEICRCYYFVTFLDQTPIFDWSLIRWGSKNKRHKDIR